MTAGDLVLVDRSDAIATIRINRPGRHNSLVPELLAELEEAIAEAAASRGTRAVILAAEGRSFSTGGDVAGFAAADDVAAYAAMTVGALHRVMLAMIELPLPVVAAVHGMVTGGSIGLVLASDVVVVGPEASFTPWYSEVGFAPDGGWSTLLPAIIGRARAADVLLRNRTISAQESVDWGMASVLVSGDAAAAAREVATGIASAVPGMARAAKRGWWDPAWVAAVLEGERRRFVEQIVTDEARRGMARFLER